MYSIHLILPLVLSLLVLLQWRQPQNTAGSAHPSVLSQNLGAGAIPQAANHALAAQGPENPKREFMVFDATFYQHKPDLTRYGLRPVSMVFWGMIWPVAAPEAAKDATTTQKANRLKRTEEMLAAARRQGMNLSKTPPPRQDPLDVASLPDRDRVRKVAVEASRSTGIAVLDIEHWPLTGDPATVEASIKKYQTLLQWCKEAAPSGQFGYYGVAPLRDYWASIQPINSPRYIAWQKLNDSVASIARLADILFPSVYTFGEDQEGWSTFAIAQIQEARRYGGGKPVYIFLWPQYHPEAGKGRPGTYLRAEYWRMQLEIARKYADGVVIWGGYQETWDETAPWWLETKQFLESIASSNPQRRLEEPSPNNSKSSNP